MYGGVVAARIQLGPPDGQQIYGKLEQRNEATALIYCKAEMIWKILAKLRFDEIRTSVPVIGNAQRCGSVNVFQKHLGAKEFVWEQTIRPDRLGRKRSDAYGRISKD